MSAFGDVNHIECAEVLRVRALELYVRIVSWVNGASTYCMSELREPFYHAIVVGDVEPRLVRLGRRLGQPRPSPEQLDGLLLRAPFVRLCDDRRRLCEKHDGNCGSREGLTWYVPCILRLLHGSEEDRRTRRWLINVARRMVSRIRPVPGGLSTPHWAAS